MKKLLLVLLLVLSLSLIHIYIDEETLPFLFDPYVKGVKGQFGLGLSIVSKIASMFSYDVKAVNQEVGVSFIFTKE